MCNTKVALKTALGKIAGLRNRLVIPIAFLPWHKCIWVVKGITLSHVAGLKSKQHQQCRRLYIQQGCYFRAEDGKTWTQIIKVMCLNAVESWLPNKKLQVQPTKLYVLVQQTKSNRKNKWDVKCWQDSLLDSVMKTSLTNHICLMFFCYSAKLFSLSVGWKPLTFRSNTEQSKNVRYTMPSYWHAAFSPLSYDPKNTYKAEKTSSFKDGKWLLVVVVFFLKYSNTLLMVKNKWRC